MPISTIPYRTDFLEKDKDGKFTGRVSWWWVKWLTEIARQSPEDPNALISLTRQETTPADLGAEIDNKSLLAAISEPPSVSVDLISDIAAYSALAVMDSSAPPLDYVDGPTVKSQQVTTGSVAASTYASVTLTWATPFFDANYLPYVSVIEATASQNTLRIHHIESISVTQVVVGVYNDDVGGAHTGTLQVLGVHN